MNYLEGEIFYIDKPLGWTSFDAVKRLRGAMLRRMGIKKMKVGHAGTLDPLATGVMIVCSGRATKRIDELQAGVKEYVATIALGATTPSYDLETEVDATYPTEHITRELVEDTLKRFHGAIEQVPPAFSACKIDGRRAYKMARKGHEVNLKAKQLVIDDIELLEFSPESITIRVVCSKGTYIRALARDIGEALGSGGHLTALRRTRVGDITVDQCVSPDRAVELIRELPLEMTDPQEGLGPQTPEGLGPQTPETGAS
ncbi:MAG: tRNA pseudouridine(55) synthase TruB [Bacteroidales bacterium]|nr:tRNA pseudouridine(55) synthase TruB [Bacteroidales bacterium]